METTAAEQIEKQGRFANPWATTQPPAEKPEPLRIAEDEGEQPDPVVELRAPEPIRQVPGIDVQGTFLPVADSGDIEGLVLVGAHGGAGTSTLAELTGLADGGHVWPEASGAHPNAVMVVCRGNLDGLDAALHMGRVAASGMLHGVQVWGLVVVADIPERRRKTPPVIEQRIELSKGAYPLVLRVDWIDGLRTREEASVPRQSRKTLSELESLDSQRKEQYAHAAH